MDGWVADVIDCRITHPISWYPPQPTNPRATGRYKQLGLIPGGLFTSNGPLWRRDRRILNPKFQYHAVVGYLQGFNRHTQAFVDAVRLRLLLEPTRPRTPGRRADPHEGTSVILDMVGAFFFGFGFWFGVGNAWGV